MKKKPTSLLFAALILCAVSCKKSQSGAAASSLIGDYKFVDIQVDAFSTVGDAVFGGTDHDVWTFADYTTINNGGGLTIGENLMSTANLTYGISTTLIGLEFINGPFKDSTYTPFDVTVSSTNNTFSYKLVGRDSIYFPSGFVIPPGAGWPVQTHDLGAIYSVIGDRLIMTIIVPEQGSIETNGADTHSSSARATETINFIRQ